MLTGKTFSISACLHCPAGNYVLLWLLLNYNFLSFFFPSLLEFVTGSSPDLANEMVLEGDVPQQVSLPRISAIAVYSKGFACSAGSGVVLLFEKIEDKEGYREIREIRVGKKLRLQVLNRPQLFHL